MIPSVLTPGSVVDTPSHYRTTALLAATAKNAGPVASGGTHPLPPPPRRRNLSEIVGPNHQGLRARIYLSLFVCLSLPIVSSNSFQILKRMVEESLLFLRLLGSMAESDPAIGGMLILYTIAQILDGKPKRLPDGETTDDSQGA